MSPRLLHSETRTLERSERHFAPALPDLDAQLETIGQEEARSSILFLGLGLLLSPIFAFLPYLQFYDWFLTSLFHEVGHCFFSWMVGQPAFPAISLTGHAAAVHQDQLFLLALLIFGGLVASACHVRDNRALFWGLVTACVLQPLFAFTGAKEALFLAGGHLGELTFATLCFWRTLNGGFTQNTAERLLYAVLGWYLVGHNFALCLGLMFSDAARAEYASNGSFGMTNDYLRLAHEVLGVGLPAVAFGMLLVSLVPLPVALWLWRREL
jgi:hypothetical protein